MEKNMKESRALCISHGEDADGLTCAALLRRLKGVDLVLTTYDDLMEALQGVVPPLDELYICDLNLREELVPEINRILKFASVKLIDHHPQPKEMLQEFREAGVEMVHSPRDCASVLLYDQYREELGREAGRLAAHAAWADQFEDGPIAEMLLRDYDRQLTQLEGLMLAYALTRNQDHGFRSLVVEELTKLTIPHRIAGVSEIALSHMEDMTQLIDLLPSEVTRMKVLAYIRAPDDQPIGTVAGLVTDSVGVDVGLCYHEKTGGNVNISIRSKRGLDFHLGDMTRSIASRHAGFGGGHKRASGASLPAASLQGFIDDLDDKLARHYV